MLISGHPSMESAGYTETVQTYVNDTNNEEDTTGTHFINITVTIVNKRGSSTIRKST